MFFGNGDNNYICRHCWSSYTSENMIIKHKQQCNQKQITSIKTSYESRLYYENLFHQNPLYFRIYAEFAADNEKDNSSLGKKTTNFYKQKPVCIGYEI